ncbi:MAG: N-6 DNA methylase, partial [Prevotellaceae bacterium]|nr:N-6 DNA methylase [Prevotellaceae bacterium]
TASKKGIGKGRPEFIITFNRNSDLLIVIECKADITKHESPNRDKYADFAVDGVLLYASFLSKDFDVLAIAVSGETKQQLKVSHFLHLKGDRKATSIFGDKLLPAADYLNGYLKSPEKFRQDYNTLLAFTKTLNDKLHTYKIPEDNRALLLSCILIALEDKAFHFSYDKKSTPKSLADFLTKTVSEKFEEANISHDKLDNLNIQFGFIKTDTSLTTKEGLLKELIDEIDTNINQFIKTHEYFDVLGQLYIEFLRYANSDTGLGIVLTPPHITEFFVKLAQVNKNAIVYDNCTGTGGFLIAAMKEMIDDAKGDEEKIREIKLNQLIGTEYQAHIFALAVSNMYIHQDGKTNVINGDCFDAQIIKQIKEKRPTVGLLNPPYQSNKKTDIDEFEFILNNLECLTDGGTCVAIVPMNKALSKKGKAFELKKKILEKHTLRAVLSMPDELFINSKVNVITCIMIFTAHKPHDSEVETYFGYYKNDNFEKRKNLGRNDVHGKWVDIREKWINYYKRGKEEAGLSVKQKVSVTDEWCAEAYMETDYTILNKAMFIKEILKYVTFRFFMQKIFDVSNSPCTNIDIDLDTENWEYFSLKQLFRIEKGRDQSGNNEIGEYALISATRDNNGLNSLILEGNKLFPKNTITVPSNGASTGEAFYQPDVYYATGDVNILNPKFKINPYIALFLSTVIRLDKYRFNYGRKWGKDRMEQSKIKLPSGDSQPDWQFMEDYIKSLPYSKSI